MQPRIEAKPVAGTEAEPQRKPASITKLKINAIVLICITTLITITMYAGFSIWMGIQPRGDAIGTLYFAGIVLGLGVTGIVVIDSDDRESRLAFATLVTVMFAGLTFG